MLCSRPFSFLLLQTHSVCNLYKGVAVVLVICMCAHLLRGRVHVGVFRKREREGRERESKREERTSFLG